MTVSPCYFERFGIVLNNCTVYCTIDEKIHGPNTTIDPKIAMIFGTNVRVCSWIEVVAWNIEMIRPTIIPTKSMGAESRSNSRIPERTRLTTKPKLILLLLNTQFC